MTAITVAYGSCIDIDYDFFDESGEPEDITGDTFSILSASGAAFDGAVFTKPDPANGKMHMFLSAAHARGLRLGNVNWFRLRRIVPGGCEDNTPPIRINVA